MTDPITIDVPHKLGLAAARARLDKGASQIAQAVPGGTLKTHRWEGNTLHFTIEAMGQRVATKIEVSDTRVRAQIDLPPMLALFAAKIRATLQGVGTKLLH